MKYQFIFSLLLVHQFLFGQTNPEVNLTDYIKEVQIWTKEQNNMSHTLWLPTSYWDLALKDNPSIPKQTVTQLKNTFKDYIFLCALDVTINSDGSFSFTSESDLRKSLYLQDSSGTKYYPLNSADISSDAKEFSKMLTPMFSQMLGQFGSGMYFYFFKVKDKKGNNLIDEFKTHDFNIYHSNKSFNYNLPLVALLPPKVCPIDQEEMKGNWLYCPFHGSKL